MAKKWMTGIVFVCSLLTLVISLKLFINMCIFVDEYSTTPSVVCGGEFWLYADWLRLALSAMSTLISGILLFWKKK